MDKKRIVVVEDNAADVFVLQEALAGAGVDCELVGIEDGEEARSYILAANKQKPDLFVVDLNLPKVDGTEILKLIREQPSLARVPVVAWSSAQMPPGSGAMHDLGASHFVVKPSSLEAFLKVGEVIRRILEEKSAAANSSLLVSSRV